MRGMKIEIRRVKEGNGYEYQFVLPYFEKGKVAISPFVYQYPEQAYKDCITTINSMMRQNGWTFPE